MAGRRGRTALIAATAILTPALFGVGTAQASTVAPAVVVGNTYQVCSTTLALRTTPEPTGPDQGTLNYGDHVVVEGTYANGMLYVWAEGQLNRHGYVDDGHFCGE